MLRASTQTYHDNNLDITCGDEGHTTADRPLIQFCTNDTDWLFTVVRPHRTIVNINLDCAWNLARKGEYNVFLQDNWGLTSLVRGSFVDAQNVGVTGRALRD